MGYSKIIQYANVTEIYRYEKEIKQKIPSTIKAWSLQKNIRSYGLKRTYNVIEERKKLARSERKAKGNIRSQASIKRSKDNFFRLCHQNNYHAKSIHFVTLTFAYDCSYQQATRAQSDFFARIKKISGKIPVSYISVPELTKKGRFHFHLLVYNLPPQIAGTPIFYRKYNKRKKKHEIQVTTTERFTRNLQRQFGHGYLDICPALYSSRGIAGYMVKYMGKSFQDTRYQTTRGYNCSQNIIKPRTAQGNTILNQSELLIPTADLVECLESSYDVPYMGKCSYTKITTLIK